MIDYSRYYRAYKEMQQTLKGDFARGYITGAMGDSDPGNDVLAGNAYNRVIDMDWVIAIEECLPYMDKAIREDRKFIETIEEVERIDKVQKIGTESVRHLTQHTNFIQSVDKNGDITPSKLLNIRREESYLIYENRFLYTLIMHTIRFVEDRFRAMKDAPNDSFNQLSMEREVVLNQQKFSFNISYKSESHERDKIDKEADVSTLTDYERISRIRMMLTDFVNTTLMQALRGCIPVRSPINKTNCIKKDPNFVKCYQLWVFVEGYKKTGYVVENNEYSGEMPSEMQRSLYDIMGFNHFVMTLCTNNALKDKLEQEYVAENERIAAQSLTPDEERQKLIEEKIYEVRREEMAIRLKEIRERELIIAKLTAELEQEKEKVRQRDLKITELQGLLTQRERELEQTKEQLRLALQRVAELEVELEQAKARIAELEAQVEQLLQVVAAQKAEIEALNITIAEQRQVIQQQKAEIEALTAEVARLNAVIEEKNTIIEQQKAEISELKSIVAAHEATIARLTAEVSALIEENTALKSELAQKNQLIIEQQGKIESLTDTVTEQTGVIQKQTDEITAFVAQTNRMKATIEQNTTTIDEQSRNIVSLNSTVEQRDRTVASLKHDVASLNGDISALNDKIEDQTEEIETLSKANEEKAVELFRQETSAKQQADSIISLQTGLDESAAEVQRCEKLIDTLKQTIAQTTAVRERELAKLSDKQDKALQKAENAYNAKLKQQKSEFDQKVRRIEREKGNAYAVEEARFNTKLKQLEQKIKAEYEQKLDDEKKKYKRKTKRAQSRADAFVKKARASIKKDPESVIDLAQRNNYIEDKHDESATATTAKPE